MDWKESIREEFKTERRKTDKWVSKKHAELLRTDLSDQKSMAEFHAAADLVQFLRFFGQDSVTLDGCVRSTHFSRDDDEELWESDEMHRLDNFQSGTRDIPVCEWPMYDEVVRAIRAGKLGYQELSNDTYYVCPLEFLHFAIERGYVVRSLPDWARDRLQALYVPPAPSVRSVERTHTAAPVTLPTLQENGPLDDAGRTFRWKDTTLHLTSKQAGVFMALWSEGKRIPLTWEEINDRAGISESTPLKNTFRGFGEKNDGIDWKTIIVPGKSKGVYQFADISPDK